MKIEKLETSNNKFKYIIIGFIIAILLVILINYLTSRASYRNTQSIPLMSGTINYSVKNVNHIYVKEDANGSYKEQNSIPKGNYILNVESSYCTKKPSTDHLSNVTFEYNSGLGTLNITGIPEIKAICHIYFDIDNRTPSEKTLALLGNFTVKEETTFSGTSHATDKVVYKLQDNDGYTYVFRGNPDNWVTFAGKTWRIIRINGDGTLRLLYYCGDTTCTTSKNAVSSKAYKTRPYNDNTYVGYYYGTAGSSSYATTHKSIKANKSTIAGVVNKWYEDNLKTSYADKLSGASGWCNDRTISATKPSGYTGNGTGTTSSVYGATGRFVNTSWQTKTPVTPQLTCNQNDLFTTESDKTGNKILDYPIGLIAADEAAIGGLLYYGNSSYYETGSYVSAGSESYWTMSPSYYNSANSYAFLFRVNNSGYLDDYYVHGTAPGVRPVINVDLNKVKSITGKGTSDERFTIT